MSLPLTVTISAPIAAGQAGSKSIGPFSIVGSFSFDQVDARTLTTGDNTFTLPTAPGAPTGCVIEPPSTNANPLKLKGVGGDTGIVISKTNPTLLSFDTTAPPTSIIVNSTGAMTAGTVLVVTWF